MADSQHQVKLLPMSGKLVTAADGAGIGDNFQTLKNMRYSPNGIRGISGMSKINTTALSTYTNVRGGFHFKKSFPAAESHILVQAENSAGTAAQVLDNTSAIPAQGDFSATVIHADPSGFSRGRFDAAPNGQLVYCNGKEALIWGGDETPNVGFIAFDTAGSFSYDYTDQTTNLSTSSYATLAASSAGIDANTSLLLHLDNDVVDASPTVHTVTNSNVTFSTTTVFGTHSGLFNGTNAKLTIPDHADFTFTDGTWTIDCRVRVASLAADNPIYYQGDTGAAHMHFEVHTTGAVHFSIHSTGDVETVSMTSAAGIVSVDTWYHFAVVENGDDYMFFIDGSLVASTNDTDRPEDFGEIVQIGFNDNETTWLNGYIDELRVSKTARWTASFTPPTAAYTTGTPADIYVASLVPLSGVKLYVGTANTTTSTATVKYWDGSSWTDATTVVDGTSSGGISLAQTGAITFDSTAATAEIKHIEGKVAYWYHLSFTAVDASTTVYFASVKYPMQQVKDIWDGIYIVPLSVQYESSTGAISDNTINVAYEDYTSANTASFMNIGSMPAAAQFYVGFLTRQSGFLIVIPTVNTAASVLIVEYWNGEDWAAVSGLVDGTSKSGKVFAQSGSITWNQPAETQEFKKIVSRGFPLYYYRVSVSNILSGSVRIDMINGIPAQEEIPGFDFAFVGQDRIWLCGQSGKDRNMARCSSSGTTAVWNGSDTTKVFFGDNTPLTAGARLYSQFGSTLLDLMVFTKEHETWLVSGGGPSDWVKFPAGLSIGCVAPLTMTTAHITANVSTGINLHVAIFQASDGVYMFDGRNFTRLSNDIENFFDPNASDTMNPSMRTESVGFYDQGNMEYHWLFASGESTTLNREFVFSVKYNKWSEISRGTKLLQFGLPVTSTAGNGYTYGFIDTGYMERLENGTTFDGDSITFTVKYGDVFLADSPAVETMAHRLQMAVVAKSTTTSSISGTYYVNTVAATVGSSFTMDMTDSTKRVIFPTASMPRQKGVLHSFQWQVTTNNETIGFEPLYASVVFTTERTHKNG